MQYPRLAGLVVVLLPMLGVLPGSLPTPAGKPIQTPGKLTDHVSNALAFQNPVKDPNQQQPAAEPGDFITSVAFSPDGKTVATSSFYSNVKLWDVATGKNSAILNVREAQAVAFSPDRKTLACCCSGNFGVNGLRPEGVKLYDVGTGKFTALPDEDGVQAIVFSPDGTTLACCSNSVKGHAIPPVVRLWNVATGKTSGKLALSDHKRWLVSAIAFHPDGKTLAIGGGSHDATFKVLTPEVKLWDVATGKNTRAFTGHTGHVLTVAFSPDGKLLASGGNDTTVRLWDVATGQSLAKLTGHTKPVYCVKFSPDGKTLVSGGDETIRLWDVATSKPLWKSNTVWVQSVAFSPDGKTLVSAGDGNQVKLWDAATGKNLKTMQ